MSELAVRIFAKGVDSIADDAEALLDKVGDALLLRTRRLVPKRTFSLHDSLTKELERDRKGITLFVGVDEDFVGPSGERPALYAALVEGGTSKMAAQPYLVPALLQTIAGLK